MLEVQYTNPTNGNDSAYNGNFQASQKTEEHWKKTTISDVFEDLYSYPPKFQIKWNNIDELTHDLLLEQNDEVQDSTTPFIDFVEQFLFQKAQTAAIENKITFQELLDGYLNKIHTSNFYLKKTREIQNALSPVPVFVILNGQKDIILNNSTNQRGNQSIISYINKELYDSCRPNAQITNTQPKLGFFFLDRIDAETYLEEIAKNDIDGTATVGLSINCIGLDSAYRITRENHPGIDFRFIPNFTEVKNLLNNNIGKGAVIVNDEQQQLRLRTRTVNLFPILERAGKLLLPYQSFLQRDEYFKGVPIYIVQLQEKPKNRFVESLSTILDPIDSGYARVMQGLNHLMGFGNNWIMQGSFKETQQSKGVTNYIFFEKKEATKFIHQEGRKIVRYTGSRTSNTEFLVKKPKIHIYNLEDFLESWEENLLVSENNKQKVGTIFDAQETFIIASKEAKQEIVLFDSNPKVPISDQIKQTLNLRYRVFKNYLGFFFGIGYGEDTHAPNI